MMASYGNFNINRKKKGKKALTVIICIAVILLAIVFYIGITAGSDGEGMQRVSTAVEENTKLKEQISELEQTISLMQSEIDGLNAQLEARPTIQPTPYTAQGVVVPTPTTAAISPRGQGME